MGPLFLSMVNATIGVLFGLKVHLNQVNKELELEQEHSFLIYECSFQRLIQTNKELELEQEHSFLIYQCSFQRLDQNHNEQEWEPRTRILRNV